MSHYSHEHSPLVTDESCYFCQDTGLICGPTDEYPPEYCSCIVGRHADALAWDHAITAAQIVNGERCEFGVEGCDAEERNGRNRCQRHNEDYWSALVDAATEDR